MRRTTLTAALLIGLALRPADARAASDPHAKKPAASAHVAAKAPDAHAAKTSGGHAAKAADGHAAKAPDGHGAKTPPAHAAKSTGHGAKPADAHAAKPADAHGGAAKAPAADASHAAQATAGHGRTAGTKPMATDLHALGERIQERVAEVRKAQHAATTTASKPRAHATAAAATSSQPRVRVDWKIAVSWPEELQPPDAVRVSVSWSGTTP